MRPFKIFCNFCSNFNMCLNNYKIWGLFKLVLYFNSRTSKNPFNWINSAWLLFVYKKPKWSGDFILPHLKWFISISRCTYKNFHFELFSKFNFFSQKLLYFLIWSYWVEESHLTLNWWAVVNNTFHDHLYVWIDGVCSADCVNVSLVIPNK